ncbi:hypothetical protein [Abyssisolibacter fermentans]|uniref:hypothetical protein n=1 Tax=Abyssisolibacter fermentans TaxID=1766203 RepID=UPI00082F191D|nr:hypothetical protein [Abyssisolibacter fermentans]
MKKKRKTDVFNKQVNKQKGWQDRQHDPKYYKVEDIHPVFTNSGRSDILGWAMIITSVIFVIIMMLVLKSIFQIKDIVPISILAILFNGLMLLQFIDGIRLIKSSTSIDSLARIKKKLIIFSCCVASIVVLLTIINEFFLEKESSININDVKSIKLLEENNKNYLIINNGELMLNCKFSDFHDVWEIIVTDGKASLWIKYEWNLLHPEKGRIIKMQVIE